MDGPFFATVNSRYRKNRDEKGLLLLFNEILSKGFDGHIFLNGLCAHLRDLLVASDPRTLALLEVGNDVQEQYREQSKQLNSQRIFESLKVLTTAEAKYKSTTNVRLLVELCLLQLAEDLSTEKKKS